MTQKVSDLLAEALRLSDPERRDLAARLIESLDRVIDADVKSAWIVEIERRIMEIREGCVKPLTWPEARQLILEDQIQLDRT